MKRNEILKDRRIKELQEEVEDLLRQINKLKNKKGNATQFEELNKLLKTQMEQIQELNKKLR